MFSIETRPISYLIQLILLVSPLLLATGYRTFVDEPFEVSCEFSFSAFISITWYHNGTIDLGTGTLTNNGSTLTINDTTFSDSGDYHCVGTEGSNSSNSTPISITVVVPYAPDVISLSVSSIEYFSAVVSWNGTDMSPPLTETYSILVNRVGSNEEVNLTVPMGSTTFTIPNLIPNNAYEVYVEATNRFSTTQGSTTSFNTSSLRLYFVHRDGNIVPIATGSIFRGGTFVQYPVTEFHCYPNRPEQEITWYQPNGDVIPTSGSGFKSTRDLSTGESVFNNPQSAISYDNEGDNFTCSFLDTSNETITSSLGIYFARKENFISQGIRLYGQGNLVYEFVYQRGTFSFNFTQSYTVECIRDSLPLLGEWKFIPALLSTTDITTKDSVLTDVQFDPSEACQYIQCAPTEEYIAVSNQPFFVQTYTTVDPPSFLECIEENHEFTYQFGESINIRITCPLVFGAHFLDIATITQLQGTVFTDSRRLWFDPSTLATYLLDREFVCEDMYGERVSFRIIVDGIEEIQVLADASSSVGITNNTNLIGNSEIPNYLLCVTQDNSNSATWYVDSNPNRNTAESVPVTNDTTQMPHVVSQRNGRSDLILDGTIRDGAEGFYSCVTNPQVRVGIFLEIPQSPIVEITANPQNIQVTITTTTLILVCNSTNMPYPNPIYFWTGNMNFNTSLLDTSLLLEADTGVYTCTGSNVVGLSIDTITITVIPPPPQFNLIQIVTTRPIFVSDTFTIQCQFRTLINVTSMFSVEWYINGASVIETSNVSIATSTSAGVGTSVLTVMNSVLSQEGNYSCIARVGDSGATNSGNSAFNFDFPPTPVVSIDPLGLITDYITQDVNITCLVTTLDRFQVALKVDWYQNATIVNTNGNIEIITMTLNATTIESILIITSLVANNAGVYHCVGQIIALLNSEEAMSDVVTVDVTGPPAPTVVIASINPITDYITQNVTIFCYSTALSRFQAGLMVYWYQNGTMVDRSGNIEITTVTLNATTTKSTLSITSLVIDNAGVYHCVGQIIDILNSEEAMSGVITVDVTGPPAPTVTINPLDPISEYITENVSIACVLTTQSQFQDNLGINWYQNGTNINTGGNIEISKIDLSTTTTKSTLSITSLVVNNAGMYHCVGQIIDILNSEEAMSGVISLQVIGPPTPIVSIDSLTPITDYITQNVSITCLVTTLDIFQGALNIEWHKNATIVDTSGNIEITAMNLNATTTKSILKITSLVVNNAGMYQCVGQIIDIVNSEEAMSGVISLQVIGPPTPIVSIDSLTPITDYITQDVSITCLVTTLDIFQGALNIEWHKNATIVDTSGNIEITAMNLNATTTKSILKITSLVVNNAGMYQCVGQIIDIVNSEEAMSGVISLQVIGPPTPIVSIDSLTPITDYITQNVSITCLVTTLDIFQGALNIEWHKNATIVDTSGNIEITAMNLNATTTKSILKITSLVVNNAGMYQCVGQIIDILNSEEAMSDVINLQVIGPPTPIVSIDSVTPITDYITQDVSITCLVTTLDIFQGALNVEWHQNATIVDASGNIDTLTITLNSTTTKSILRITSLKVDNAGMYHCVAQIMALINSEEAMSDVITVDVTGPPAPIVEIDSVNPIIDYITQNVSITCVLTTLSRFQAGLMVDWYQNGIMVDTSGNIEINTVNLNSTTTESILSITSLVVDNNGTYYCVGQIIDILNSEEAMSNVITVEVTGAPAPIVTVNPIDPISDFITQNVTIFCYSTTLTQFQDSLSINWYQNGTMVDTSGNIDITNVTLNATTTQSTLTITSLVVENAGIYRCGGQIIALINSAETMSDIISVEVTGPPAPMVVIASINPITDYITQNVTIFCYSTALSRFQAGLMVYWYQNGTMVDRSGNIEITTVTLNATTTKSTLSITSLVIDNAGVYHCVGQIIDILNSVEAISDITVDVTGPPAPTVMINPLDPISEYITENVSIACVLTTQSQFQDNLGINWYQNGTNINTGGNIEISKIDLSTTTTKSTLSITSLVVNNAGMYHCVGQIIDILNSEEAMSGVISLQVIGPPTPIVSIDSLTPITDYITQNVSITCLVTTLDIFQGALNIEWHKNATIVDTSGNIEITAMNLNATTTKSILKITSLVVNNAGMYQCVGQIIDILNSEEAMSDVISLQVIGPPTPIVSIDSVTPITDYITQDVSITCLVTTLDIFQGALNIEWHKNATIVDTSGNIEITAMNLNATTTKSILKITSLVVNNAGMYQCVGQIIDIVNSEEAMSDVISLQVIGPPTPIVSIDSLTPITDYITQNVSITCLATTLDIFQGALNIEWHKNATIVDTSGNIEITAMNLNATTTKSILKITSLVVNNAGMYQCVGQIIDILNSEEAMSGVISLQVIGPPTPIVSIDSLTPITDYITQNVSITCLATTLDIFQGALNVEWYQNATIVNTSGNIGIATMNLNSTTRESILTITSLEVDNAGMYHCVGQIMALLNSEEAMSNVITVDVTGPPAPTVAINPVDPITEYITQNVVITCLFTTLARFQASLSISWNQNGTNTGGNIEISTMHLNSTTTESMLTITSLVANNTGTYYCVGQIIALLNSEKATSNAITVDVTGPPTPIVAVNPVAPISDYITQNITLICEYTTLARFQNDLNIEWYQNGIKVTTGNIIQSLNYLDGTTTRSEINIVNLTSANAGEYHCVAQIVRILNSGLGNSTAINIQTTIPPTPTPGFNRIYREYNFELYEDFTFHLHCNFTTVDVLLSNLNIDWFRDSSQIQTSMNVQISTVYQGLDTKDSILTIQKASQSDTGKYYCVGRIGTFDSAIYPDYSITINPTVDIPDIDVTVSSMDTNSVTLSFNPSQVGVAMNGSETYAIYYRVAGSDDHYQVYDAKTSLSITISDLMPGTEYEYIVQTTNEFGSTNSSSSMVSTSAVDVTVAPTSTTVNVTVTPTSTAVNGTVPPTSLEAIIGAVIGILIIAIVVVVLLLLLVCWMKTRNKKPRQQRVINQRYARNTQRTSSERVLLTKSTGVGATLSERNYSYTTDETQEKSSTFRRTEGVQETVLMNIETGAAEPLYEDFSYERYNVPIGEFSHKVLEYHLANNAEFDRQFSGLRKDFIHDVTTGSNIVNKPKNRFANIIPYEHSRVKLNVTGDNFSDYINACSIDGYYKPQSYIAAQGPMPNTVHDFWRLIWEKNIEHIVALTRVMEALKKKCEQYWPELENNSCNYGPIEVTLKRVDRFTSYDIRMLELKHKDYLDDTRTVIQFHFIIWPDHGVPIFSSSLLSFINHTKEYHIPGKQEAPLLVHCSAGVGRTGTFIVLDYFIEHLKENDKINVYKMVAQLREARCLMVQTKDQFMFIHDAIQDLITCKDTFVSDHEFQPYLENALIRNLKTMTTPFEDKYELIMRTSRIIDPRDTNESSDLANVMKNRYPEFVPFDSHRVTIIPDHDGDKDYINASFVHSYQRHKGFIAAQSPLDYTVYDFWKMITKYRVQLVVMLSELFEDGHEMSAKYWPEEGKEMLVHYLVIRCEKEEVFEDFVRRKIVVSTEQGGINQSIQQIQFKRWKVKELPVIDDILTLYHQFNQVERGLKSKEPVPIVVHCDNGATRTGTFIASINAIQQLELERKVDIFQIVRNLRNSRPCMVPSLDLYIFLFKLIASYIQSYEEKAYANFV